MREAAIDVDMVNVDVGAINPDPTDANPTVVINSRTIPMPVAIEPRANCQPRPEGKRHRSRGRPGADVNNLRIVNRHIDVPRLRRNNRDVATTLGHRLL